VREGKGRRNVGGETASGRGDKKKRLGQKSKNEGNHKTLNQGGKRKGERALCWGEPNPKPGQKGKGKEYMCGVGQGRKGKGVQNQAEGANRSNKKSRVKKKHKKKNNGVARRN